MSPDLPEELEDLEADVVEHIFNREQADLLLTLRTSPGYELLVELINREIGNTVDALENIGNTRDDDVFLKGVVYSYRWILKQVESAHRMVREEE